MYSVGLYRNGEYRSERIESPIEVIKALEKHFFGVDIGRVMLWRHHSSISDEFEIYSKDFNEPNNECNVSATVEAIKVANHALAEFTQEFIDGLYKIDFLGNFYKDRIKHNKQPVEVYEVYEADSLF